MGGWEKSTLVRGGWGWLDVQMEPPAEIWQNSYRPSNTGQSSPTLTRERDRGGPGAAYPLYVSPWAAHCVRNVPVSVHR